MLAAFQPVGATALPSERGSLSPDGVLASWGGPAVTVQTVNLVGVAGTWFYDVLTVEASVNSRTSQGGTAPVRVREQVARWKALLDL